MRVRVWLVLRAALEKNADGVLATVTEGKGDPTKDVLVEVFRDGFLLVDQTCEEIRVRAAIPGCPTTAAYA